MVLTLAEIIDSLLMRVRQQLAAASGRNTVSGDGMMDAMLASRQKSIQGDLDAIRDRLITDPGSVQQQLQDINKQLQALQVGAQVAATMKAMEDADHALWQVHKDLTSSVAETQALMAKVDHIHSELGLLQSDVKTALMNPAPAAMDAAQQKIIALQKDQSFGALLNEISGYCKDSATRQMLIAIAVRVVARSSRTMTFEPGKPGDGPVATERCP